MPEILDINDVIFDRIIDHHIDVLRMASNTVVEVLRRLRRCDADTCTAIANRVSEDGSLSTHIDTLLREVRRINDEAYHDIGDYLARELKETAHYESDFAFALLEQQMARMDRRPRSPKRAMLSAIITEEPFVGGLLSEWIEGLSTGRFQRVRAQIRLAVSQGDSVNQIFKRIRGTRKLNFRDGIASSTARSAKAMVNTAYNHVVNKSRTTVYKTNDNFIVGQMWSAVLDDATCDYCAAMDGTLFEIDDEVDQAHINCRCITIPVIAEDEDDFDFELPPPKKQTYETWLKKQSLSRQDEILGPARGALFRSGMPIKKFSDSSGVRYNLPELRRIEAKAMAKGTKRKSAPQSRVGVLKNFGWRPDLPDKRDRLFTLSHPEAIAYPSKISLRDRMPPVFAQGTLGSCVAQALIANHMFVHAGEQMMSRLDLYYHARLLEGMEDVDSGCMIRNGVKALVKFGVPTEADWPYLIRKFKVDPPDAVAKSALNYRITSYERLRAHDDFLKCLSQGRPFVFGFSVYQSLYESYGENFGLITMPRQDDKMIGGHAILAVGFDQNFHENPAFKRSGLSESAIGNFVYEIRNSWGTAWGDGGYGWMDARILEDRDQSDDFWCVYD